jgi:hypothetical protein
LPVNVAPLHASLWGVLWAGSMGARKVRAPTKRRLDCILEPRRASSRAYLGGGGSCHYGDRSRVARDAPTLGTGSRSRLVFAPFTAERQLVVLGRD